MSGNFKAYLAEFLGTFALVVAAAGAVSMQGAAGAVTLTPVALSYGAASAMALFAFGPASGGHFNPAVTLGMLLGRRLDGITALFYFFSQLLGAAVAGSFLKSVLHDPALASAAPYLGSCDLTGVGFRAGTLIEAVATFFLVATFMSTTSVRKGPVRMGPMAVGLAVVFGVIVAGPVTGAALNPARAFGPAVASGHWSNWYVYWMGPLAGGAAAGLLQDNIFDS